MYRNWNYKPLLNVIFSYLSNETKKFLKNKDFNLSQQKPLFNYISFCKYLELHNLERIIDYYNMFDYIASIINDEVFKLFIKNAKITHLYIPRIYRQIPLIPEAKHCFSELKFLQCFIN